MHQAEVDEVADAVGEALTGAGVAMLREHLDTGTVLHMPGSSGLAGEYQGVEAIMGLLERMTAASGGTLGFATTDVAVGPRGGLRLSGVVRGRRLGRALLLATTIEADVVDGVIREAGLSCEDQAAWDAFWR